MSQKKVIFLVTLVVLVAGAVAAYSLLPKQYVAGESLSQADVFWNNKEAFFFLHTTATGKSTNFLLNKLEATRFGMLAFLLGTNNRFFEQKLIAYRLVSRGELEHLDLPAGAATFGTWSLQDGKLQLNTAAFGTDAKKSFRWDGEKLVAVSPELKSKAKADESSKLSPDDLSDDDDDRDGGFLTAEARKEFKDAGWHYKQVFGYQAKGTKATLPIVLGKDSFDLTIEEFPRMTERTARIDLLNIGTKSLEISKSDQTAAKQVLWSNNGWQPISKSDFESHAQRSRRPGVGPWTYWGWLAIFLLVVVWKLSSWGSLIFTLFGTKRRVLKNMATSYSFPPATTVQFPQLDTAALERYTQEFERLGFVRLLDFSLVSNAPNPIPSFCRLFVHTRNHCFGEVSQLFPRGKAPMALKCSIQSSLQDGWSLAFSDRKPQAASSLLRRKKALGVNMPEATIPELLHAFLQMRDQVCQDLGISPMKDDTLEAYFAKVQRTATEMREAVKQKNFVSGVSHVYYRKLSLLKTKEEYTWLGDYPKEAEQRKQGFVVPSRAV